MGALVPEKVPLVRVRIVAKVSSECQRNSRLQRTARRDDASWETLIASKTEDNINVWMSREGRGGRRFPSKYI